MDSNDIAIDELDLGRECVRLPTQFMRHANLAVDAKRDVDEIKNRLEVIEADLTKEVRANPGKFGIEKETEKAIAAVVLTHPRYQKGVEMLSEARHKADMAQAVVTALEYKKRSLTLLVELHGLGYFSSPKISQRGLEELDKLTRPKRKFGDEE